jgi:hypothetical protein
MVISIRTAGSYVSITEHDGVQRTFRVAEVVPFEA